jgi:hypothetical protein
LTSPDDPALSPKVNVTANALLGIDSNALASSLLAALTYDAATSMYRLGSDITLFSVQLPTAGLESASFSIDAASRADAAVPEPSAASLLAAGGLLIALHRILGLRLRLH